jgi:hypothetical protein
VAEVGSAVVVPPLGAVLLIFHTEDVSVDVPSEAVMYQGPSSTVFGD